MSFARDVKEELSLVVPSARHCMLAELGAIGIYRPKNIEQDSPLERKISTLQKKTNMLETYVDINLKNSCCRRAFLRGAFLCVGSVNDPSKSYNLEFVCSSGEDALKIQDALASFEIDGKLSMRKESHVVYIKEAEQIVDTLNVMGAHNSLMHMENLRIEKEVRNSINRQVNCETSNIKKTVSAASRQIADIRKIQAKMGLEKLEEPLREMAYVRLEHEESSLTELGGYLNPAVGKSGVNHRLRKLSEIASKLD